MIHPLPNDTENGNLECQNWMDQEDPAFGLHDQLTRIIHRWTAFEKIYGAFHIDASFQIAVDGSTKLLLQHPALCQQH